MSSNIRMVGMDFDLTLIDYAGGKPDIPQATQQLLRRLIADGLEVGIVSGRPIWDMRDMLERIGMPWGNPFPSYFIARETFLFWMRDGRMEPDTEWNSDRGREAEQLSRAILPTVPDWLRRIELEGIRVARWNVFNDYGLEVHSPTEEEAERSRVLLAEWVSDIPLARVHRNRCMAQIVLATAGKGKSLLHAATAEGLKPEQVVAVGDTLNDLDMLDGRHGFRSGAVGNADDVIKDAVRSAGGIVATRDTGEGLAEILQAYIEVGS